MHEMPVDETIELIDAKGNFVAPGFINVHIHGCDGVDTMDGTEKALGKMAQALPQTGVTSFLPTTMTYPFMDINKSLETIRTLMMAEGEGARVLGCHLDGPFISKSFKGAQAEKDIVPPDFSKIVKYKDVIKIITFAPEEVRSVDFFKGCRDNNILLSMGHSAVG